MPPAIIPSTYFGLAFGDLTVKNLSRKEPRKIQEKQFGWKYYFNCLCKCGQLVTVELRDLQSGHTRSCGCLKSSMVRARNTVHGETANHNLSPEWRGWNAMLARCYEPANSAYPRYGLRGITVDDRWRGKEGFVHFLEDMGRKPTVSHTIDRIDGAQGYSSSNCRWATSYEQANNQRSNRKVVWRGQEMNISQVIDMLGLSKKSGVYYSRIDRGWSVEDTFLTPVSKGKSHRPKRVRRYSQTSL